MVAEFRSYLLEERGLAPGTVVSDVHIARLFLTTRPSNDLGLERVIPAEIVAFVREHCEQRSAAYVTAGLRAFLRFCHLTGRMHRPLADAVPKVASWRLSTLPKSLDSDTVKALLASCDRRTTYGRRAFAVLMLLVRLGLRSGEVASLRLEDIDWRAGELLIRGKGSKLERLPLPADVGEAVAAWLRRGRPRCATREVITRVRAPHGGLSSGGVSHIVCAACKRAGLPEVHAHRLRHTAATEMLRARRRSERDRPGTPTPERPHHSHLRQGRPHGAAPARHTVADGRTDGGAMTALEMALQDYLSLRRSMGFKLERAEKLLAQFVDHCTAVGADVVTTELALAWAILPEGASRNWVSYRLSVVRGFSRHLVFIDERTEVVPTSLVPHRPSRATPYLYTEDEVRRLMAAASFLRSPIRRTTYAAVVGLLWTTGMRVGEAFGLDRDDVDLAQGVLTVRGAKFDKSRELPLHETTSEALRAYAKSRDRLCPVAVTPAFFVSATGTRVLYCNFHLGLFGDGASG